MDCISDILVEKRVNNTSDQDHSTQRQIDRYQIVVVVVVQMLEWIQVESRYSRAPIGGKDNQCHFRGFEAL